MAEQLHKHTSNVICNYRHPSAGCISVAVPTGREGIVAVCLARVDLVWGFYVGAIVLNLCVCNYILYFIQIKMCLLSYSGGSNTGQGGKGWVNVIS